jgi:hypothetical protein
MAKYGGGNAGAVKRLEFFVYDYDVTKELQREPDEHWCEAQPNHFWKKDWKQVKNVGEKQVRYHGGLLIERITVGPITSQHDDIRDRGETARPSVFLKLMEEDDDEIQKQELL